MEIEFLTKLQANPAYESHVCKGISIEEILELEQLYNDGVVFPKVLRELLFLAGENCIILDYGVYDDQFELQLVERGYLLDFYNLTIDRNYFFIDLAAHGNPIFVYLDEGDDPKLYQISTPVTSTNFHKELPSGPSLKKFIDKGLDKIKLGFGLF